MDKIVICVDRDDDIKRKTGIKGPIIGIDRNIEVANSLALADPEDTDVNAMFSAIKIAKELNTEVVTLTGDKSVGVISDMEISRQLDEVVDKFKPEGVILVTDGAEDEQIIPIIESRAKIISVKTAIVRQSQELERAYFKIIQFIKEVEEDANLARLVFGIPGLVLILIAIGGIFGIMLLAMNIILAIIGIYLLIKGFGYEEEFFSKASEFINSLSVERVSTWTYIVSTLIIILSGIYGYQEMVNRNIPINDNTFDDELDNAIAFIQGSIGLLMAAFVIAIIGMMVDDHRTKKYLNVRRDIVLIAFVVLVAITIGSGADYYWAARSLGQEKIANFTISVFTAIIMFLFVVKFTEYMFIEEIDMKKNLESRFKKKEVFDTEGNRIGRVSKVLLDGADFVGLKVSRKRILRRDIVSEGEKIIVNIQD